MNNDKNSKSGKESFTKKVGDKLERVGEKLREKGASKVGDAIYRAGNKLEHSEDRK